MKRDRQTDPAEPRNDQERAFHAWLDTDRDGQDLCDEAVFQGLSAKDLAGLAADFEISPGRAAELLSWGLATGAL